MSLLTIVNNAQGRLHLPKSTTVISSTDQNVVTLLALANKEGKELAKRHPWQAIVKEQTFTGTAADVQTGAIPSDLKSFINESFFNRTQTRRLVGPLSVEEWQTEKGIVASTLTDAFRIRGDAFLITPTASTGDTYAYEYVSKNWCQSSGSVGQSAWAADSDTGILDEDLMEDGLVWRHKASKGLSYAEEFATYERVVADDIVRDGARRTLDFSRDNSLITTARRPTIAEGSWTL